MTDHLTAAEVAKLTVPKLKEALTARGLSTSGLKAALVERLQEAIGDEEEPDEPAATRHLKYITPVPYGQGEHLTLAERRAVKAYWDKINTNKEWPSWLMTFQLWCHMTGYDPDLPKEAKGGPKFQKMMLLVLGAPIKSDTSGDGITYYDDHSKSVLETDDFMWDAEASGDSRYGKMFFMDGDVTEDWFTGNTASGTPIMKAPKTRGPAHIAKTARPTYDYIRHERKPNIIIRESKPGLGLGIHDNDQTPPYDDTGKNFATMPSFGVNGKLDWEAKANIQGKNEYGSGGGHNSWMGFGTEINKHQGCWETTKPWSQRDSQSPWHPCPMFANRAAMIFGLYYYPGCTEPEYQWEMYEKVGSDWYRSRCRAPNPHYGEPRWFALDGDAFTD